MKKILDEELNQIINAINDNSDSQISWRKVARGMCEVITDDEFKEELKKEISAKKNSKGSKNDSRIKYLITKYVLERITIDQLFHLIDSLKNSTIKATFVAKTGDISILKEILAKIEEFNIIDNDGIPQNKTLKERKKEGFKLIKEIGNEFKKISFVSQKMFLNQIIASGNINYVLEKLYYSSQISIKNEYFSQLLNLYYDIGKFNKVRELYRSIDNEVEKSEEDTAKAWSALKEQSYKDSKENTEEEAEENLQFELIKKIEVYLSIPEKYREKFKEEFYNMCDQIVIISSKNYAQILKKIVEEWIVNAEPLEILEVFANKIGKDTEYKVNIEYKDGKLKNLDRIQKLKEAGIKLKANIEIKSANDLKLQELESLTSLIEVDSISINEDEQPARTQTYSLQQYIQCLEKISIITQGINLDDTSDKDYQKKIFGIIIRRLANNITYNYDYLEKMENSSCTSQELFENSSMFGALVKGTAVCSGISETARNVFESCGIEIFNYSGSREEEVYKNGNKSYKMTGHQWNIIKLDGKWYWMDLTWSIDDIVKNRIPIYLLKCDKDFRTHLDEYKIDPTVLKNEIHTSESVPGKNLASFIYLPSNEPFERFLKSKLKNLGIGRSNMSEAINEIGKSRIQTATAEINKDSLKEEEINGGEYK